MWRLWVWSRHAGEECWVAVFESRRVTELRQLSRDLRREGMKVTVRHHTNPPSPRREVTKHVDEVA